MSAIPLETLQRAGIDPWLVDVVDRLARGVPTSLDAFLISAGEPIQLDGTAATCRCHFLTRDGNDRPRLNPLAELLAHQALDYCIPRSRIDEAVAHHAATGSAEKILQLSAEAKSLFTKIQNSGEGGELLLYLLLERLLGIPQILCKMSLKTSSQMHVHGTDGVHARALANGNLALYWCESKMYKNVDKAVDACIESIAPYLLDEGGGPASRDILLVRDHLDTGDEAVTAALVRYLQQDTQEAQKLEIRGACLVGFSLDEYPNPHGDDGQTVVAEVAEAISRWHGRIQQRIQHHKLVSFEMEVFCMPMPSVEDFREALLKSLGLT